MKSSMYESERYIIGSMSKASFEHWGTTKFKMGKDNEGLSLYGSEQDIGAQCSG
jgi:hypothetical protein